MHERPLSGRTQPINLVTITSEEDKHQREDHETINYNLSDEAVIKFQLKDPQIDSSPRLAGRNQVSKGKLRNSSANFCKLQESRELASSGKTWDTIQLRQRRPRTGVKYSSNVSVSQRISQPLSLDHKKTSSNARKELQSHEEDSTSIDVSETGTQHLKTTNSASLTQSSFNARRIW